MKHPRGLDFKKISCSIEGFSLLAWDFRDGLPDRSIQLETDIIDYFLELHQNDVNMILYRSSYIN